MNFLAHLYLSGNSEGVKIGNFIGDHVKGRQFENYQGDVRKGILLHRAIDDFTDRNPIFQEAKSYFNSDYKRYSGIVGDVVFDHLLASQWNDYSEFPLDEFAYDSYHILLDNFRLLPEKVRHFVPIMINHKRLESYATLTGLEAALRTMSDHTSLPMLSHTAIVALQANYEEINRLFKLFMEEIVRFVETEYQIAIEKPAEPGFL